MFSSFADWLEAQYRPLIGREGEEDEEAAAGGSESDEEEAAGPAGSEEEDTSASATEDEDEESDEEDDADVDELERVRGERDKLRQQVAAAEAAVQKAKKEARKAREEAAKKGGNWEQVAKEREAELQEANERATGAEKRAIVAEENLDKFQREVRITRIASRLSFRDPADAIAALKEQPEVTGDDKTCERALRKLAEQKSYLVDQRRARGRAMSDSNGNALPTFDQLKEMTPEQINKAWEEGTLQQALAHGRESG